MLRLGLVPLALMGSAAAAQDTEEPIVVTGRGLQAGLGERVYDSVVIDRDRLTGSASGRIDEILKEVPGFQLFRRSDARSANPTSQGATLRALGGNASSRALLVLDGVPQSDPFGGWISWPAYDPQQLGAVRVVRGGGSGIHGPGALAGTIEMFSADPADVQGANGSLFYGSRDSVDAHAGLGARLGGGFVALSGAYGRGDGFVPIVEDQRGPADRASPYEQASVALRAVAPLSGETELQASGLWFRDERERGLAFSAIRTEGADAALRLVGRNWSALGYVQTRQFYNSFAGVDAARTTANRVSEQYNVPATGLGARFEVRPVTAPFELRLGGDWRETVGETRERFSFKNGIGTRGRVAGGRTRTIGGFAEAAWESDALTLTGAGRIDRWWIRNGSLEERVFATGQIVTDTSHPDRSGWEPTGRAGFAFRPAGALTLRGAAYLGWRLPTLNELYRPFRVGADSTLANAALRPERLRGIEAGIDYRPLSTARIGLTVFANRLEDGIANVTVGPGGGGTISQRRNLDAILARGIEIDAGLDLGPWSLSGGYSYVDAEVEADGPALPLDGRRPAQTPRHSAAATLAWKGLSGTRAALTARYVGSQYEDDLGAQRLPDALTFDAVASAPLGRRLTIEARVENATDAHVAAGISGAGIVERATPRTLWLGLRWGA
jgi:vitamin B12 transporter